MVMWILWFIGWIWCWVMKSTNSAIFSSLILGRISPAKWHEQSPGNTSCTGHMPTKNKYRPAIHTDHILIGQRKRTQSHKLMTVSSCPKPLGGIWCPTFIHDSVVENLWKSVITRKWGAWRILKKYWMIAYKRPRNRWRKWDKNWERRENSAKLKPEFTLYKSLIHIRLRTS